MEVEDKLTIDDGHSIEWGKSTWNELDFSVRNRFDTLEGRFNKAGSSEVPWSDFNLMVVESIKRQYFTAEQLEGILAAIKSTLATARPGIQATDFSFAQSRRNLANVEASLSDAVIAERRAAL